MRAAILAIGDITVDQIFGPLRELPAWGQETEVGSMEVRLGGNIGNFVLAAKTLDIDVECLGPIGNDSNGRLVTSELAMQGVNTSSLDIREDAATSVTTALVREDGERLFITLPGALTKLGDMLERCVFPPAAYAIFSGWCQPPRVCMQTLLNAFEKLQAAGTKVAMDLAWSEASWAVRDDVLKILAHVDIALMNADEARALTGESDLGQAIETLYGQLQHGTILVVKNSVHGAIVREGESPTVSVPAAKIDVPVQAVGAGDCFNAGFIHGLLMQKFDAVAAAGFGCDFATWMLVHGRDANFELSEVTRLRIRTVEHLLGEQP